jgi:hypothetical protein
MKSNTAIISMKEVDGHLLRYDFQIQLFTKWNN